MALTQVVNQLKEQQRQLQAELTQVTNALEALNSLGRGNGGRGRGAANGRRTARRVISAAGRARIAAAQRARWAKLKTKKSAK
jgi:hypothetical protein